MSLCLLLITGPCVTVMLNFDNCGGHAQLYLGVQRGGVTGFTPAAVHNPLIAVTAVRRPFLLLPNIFFFLFLNFFP